MSNSVLLVDDDPQFQRLADALLRKAGWAVHCASGGNEALATLENRQFDLMVTDLDMPLVSGLELIRKVRLEHRGLPIVVLTGVGSESEAVRSFRAGANDYVTKANVHTELVTVLDHLLRDADAAAETASADTGPRNEPRQQSGPTVPQASTSQAGNPPALAERTLESEYRIRRRSAAPPRHLSRSGDGTLQSEYIVRSRNTLHRAEPADEYKQPQTYNGVITPERLAVLRRQMLRLAKWSELVGGTKKNVRKHVRNTLGEVVELQLLGPDGVGGTSIQSFCKELSAGGCSLLHHEILGGDQWIIRFPKPGAEPLVMSCRVIRARMVILGMFDIGLRFTGRADPTRASA